MSEPRITIIINSYNYAKYIGQAIESAISQDYKNKEIIVVDDGSTDNSKEIIKSYADHITPIFHANLGQARTCLRAVHYATGGFIQFLDSDDHLLPGAIAAVAAVASPGVAKIQFQLLPVGPDGEVVGEPWPAMADNSRDELLTLIQQRGTYVTPPNSGNVYRSDIFKYIKDIDYESSIDGIAYLLAPLLGEVRQLAMPLAAYRYHSENFSGHGKLEPRRFALEARRHIDRLTHLSSIARENGMQRLSIREPNDHSFVHTRNMLERISEGRRPGLSRLMHYSISLIKEREAPARIIKLLIWGMAAQLGTNEARRMLAIYRSDPRSRSSFRLRDFLRLRGRAPEISSRS